MSAKGVLLSRRGGPQSVPETTLTLTDKKGKVVAELFRVRDEDGFVEAVSEHGEAK